MPTKTPMTRKDMLRIVAHRQKIAALGIPMNRFSLASPVGSECHALDRRLRDMFADVWSFSGRREIKAITDADDHIPSRKERETMVGHVNHYRAKRIDPADAKSPETVRAERLQAQRDLLNAKYGNIIPCRRKT